jgi:hypothetical protein
VRKCLCRAGSVLNPRRIASLRRRYGGVAGERLRAGARSILDALLVLLPVLVVDQPPRQRVILAGRLGRPRLLFGQDLLVNAMLRGRWAGGD